MRTLQGSQQQKGNAYESSGRDIFGNVANTPEHAWMEGFADYYAGAVSRAVPDGTVDVGLLPAWLESSDACDASPADAIERRVASSL